MKAWEAVGDRLLTRAEVQEVLGCKTSAFYAALKEGRIPEPIRPTPGQPRWPASVIRRLIDEWKLEAGYPGGDENAGN